MTKRVLIVCMFDSIHSAHWIERFVDSDVVIELYPSKKFRHLHPKIVKLLSESSNIKLATKNRFIPLGLLGYFDFLLNEIFQKLGYNTNRLDRLQCHLNTSSFHFVHALEIQAAGYLTAKLSLSPNSQLIVTNWGSDIYYFKNLEGDAREIRNVLQKADRYSAECIRDYVLAKELGFVGVELPVVPNSGGNSYISPEYKSQKEFLIVVKCYGGRFGRGDLAIKAVSNLLQEDHDFRVFFYSVSPEYEEEIKEMQLGNPGRIEFSTIRSGKSHNELMELFAKARIYLGCSISDGISTSFLEALSNGVYPIQSNTSCANEWIEKGVYASLVNLEIEEISSELIRRAADWRSLEEITSRNFQIARRLLDPVSIKSKSQSFYDL
jgi:glycosyltransferase involved in cell wall biosynthesis